MKLLLPNAKSLINRTSTIQDLLLDDGLLASPGFAGISGDMIQCHLQPCPSTASTHRNLHISQAKTDHRMCQEQQRGHAAAVLFPSSLGRRRRSSPETETFECICEDKRNLGLLVLYRPLVGNPINFLEELAELLISTVLESPRFLVLCDLILHIDKVNGIMVFDLTAYVGFCQAVSGSTPTTACMLDISFSLGRDIRDVTNLPLSWSDHCLIQADIRASLPARIVSNQSWSIPQRVMTPLVFISP